MGFGKNDAVFSFSAGTDRDDFTLLPYTSTDLQNWFQHPLTLLDATDMGGSKMRLRYRLTDDTAPYRFFRIGAP